MQEKINSLLKEVTFKVATLNEARERFADRLAPGFSIFDYLRTDEIGLSRCIADLLNPKGKHGQKEVFLEEFLKLLKLEKIKWSGNTKIKSVRLEEQANDQRRIDILLKFESGEIIGIENKPWAGDQENQLSDYASFIEKEAAGNDWRLIYLSNNEPSDHSGAKKEVIKKAVSEEKFVRLNYSTIVEWLEDCACKSKALIVRLFIEELAKFIRMSVNGELEMSEENEIRNLILSLPQNIESAFHVSIVLRKVKEKLLKEFHDDLEKKLKDEGFVLVWDDAIWKSGYGFNVKFNEEQKFLLRFEFQASELGSLDWGIMQEDGSMKRDDVIWNKINEVMSDQFGSSGKKSERFPWWNRINKKEFSDEYRSWSSSAAPWMSIKKEELAGKFFELANRVHKAFVKHHSLELLSGKISTDMDGGS
ncbi:PD-(D/E)XK nuclease family protein [Nitrosomonas ureae]|uniref:PD-(D/E)XK nuclease superfamily protein n=1 Tax=Nitrosomonas ureae TaxID=44577 RepID=A0A1H2DNX7_9PROT|nr:PD-(D/E)XK nuclease family protein [Nitrosomonas ureae]ALQ49823.1 hypothetical protein ATY38_00340 [Nitrosomonas ureae]SDT84637.1 PD-(D/E)XK nuclease superfamily protein [Nitrosomonas ureae]